MMQIFGAKNKQQLDYINFISFFDLMDLFHLFNVNDYSIYLFFRIIYVEIIIIQIQLSIIIYH
jgi:hypothetical protein